MQRRLSGPLVVIALLAAGATAIAAGPGAKAPSTPSCEPRYVEALGPACPLPSGDYRVVLGDGTTLRTHGPDPRTPSAAGGGVTQDQRPPVCADSWRMHVLYGYPEGSSDRSYGVRGEIRRAVHSMNALLNMAAQESGNVSADYRVVCNDADRVAVDTFEGPDSDDFSDIVSAARGAGYQDSDVDYLIFWDGSHPSYCGVGNYADDDSDSRSNENLQGPDYGVTYEPCWDGRTPMHENGHNQGAVQRLAPDSDVVGHCIDGLDVMCYTSYVAGTVLCTDRVHYDCDHDTYFDAEPEDGEWLADNWNIGSRLNRYLHFGDQPLPGTDEGAPDLSLSLADPDVATRPGGTVESGVSVANDGSAGADYNLSHAGAPDGWNVSFDEDGGHVAANASADHTVSVHVPDDAEAGSRQLDVGLHRGGDRVDEATLNVEVTEPTANLTLSADDRSRSMQPGATAEFALTMSNVGERDLTVRLTVANLSAGFEAAAEPSEGTVRPGETLKSTLTVRTPDAFDAEETFGVQAADGDRVRDTVPLEVAPAVADAAGSGPSVAAPGAAVAALALLGGALVRRRV